jgi:hypothetical protein
MLKFRNPVLQFVVTLAVVVIAFAIAVAFAIATAETMLALLHWNL